MTQVRPEQLPDESEAAFVEGVIDGASRRVLRGWAWLPHQPEAAATVQVHHGSGVLAETVASAFRADLAAAGKRGGHCAFELSLPNLPDGEIALAVTVNGQSLLGSPVVLPDVPASEAAPDIFPLPLANEHMHGSVDACGPSRIRGWAHGMDASAPPVGLRLMEGAREWMRFEASQWRSDLAELRQGDGSCGFDLSLPDALCDGALHTLQLHTVDDDGAPVSQPFRVRATPMKPSDAGSGNHLPQPLQRVTQDSAVTLSVVVNFYNMTREAARTLKSLSRAYQADIGDLDYEVLCIDNGSQPPLDAAWIESFGPEFRLIRPDTLHASPCAALNAAALQARGRYIAVMIDGAHVLTPGVFREALQAWQANEDAVVAVRHWFIGGDQRWLAVAGYSREQEDRLFARIRWPSNGYELFRIGAPIGENPEPWFDGLSESNCLMLPTALYDRMGGIDEAFDMAGGGFANLDLCRRASEMATGPLVALVGEATFHQFHGGTTTNIDDAEKDTRVRSYARAYRSLRGEDFTGVHRAQLQYRGRMPSEFATGVRQRVLLPMRLDVTDRVRPAQLAQHFDEGAQMYLQSVYAESGLHKEVTWLGQPTGVAPADLVSLQEIIHEQRPDAIVIVGTRAGLVHFVAGVLDAIASPGARILHVNPPDAPLHHAMVTTVHGAPDDTGTQAMARHWTGVAESVLVLVATEPANSFTRDTLRAYGALVSHRSYLVCLGTLFGQPWLGYSRHEHQRTVQDFVDNEYAFVIDRSRQRQWLSTCPSGYLRRVGGALTHANYDPTLDDVVGLPTSPETHA